MQKPSLKSGDTLQQATRKVKASCARSAGALDMHFRSEAHAHRHFTRTRSRSRMAAAIPGQCHDQGESGRLCGQRPSQSGGRCRASSIEAHARPASASRSAPDRRGAWAAGRRRWWIHSRPHRGRSTPTIARHHVTFVYATARPVQTNSRHFQPKPSRAAIVYPARGKAWAFNPYFLPDNPLARRPDLFGNPGSSSGDGSVVKKRYLPAHGRHEKPARHARRCRQIVINKNTTFILPVSL